MVASGISEGFGLRKICLALVFWSGGAVAGTLTGRVVDESGGLIAGATVTVVHGGSGESRVVKSDDRGGYSIGDLRAGRYTLRVEQAGFKPVERKEVGVKGEETLEVVMELGTRRESITVEGKGVKARLKRWLTCR